MQANILHEQNILQNLRYQGFILRSRTLLADVLPFKCEFMAFIACQPTKNIIQVHFLCISVN